MGDQVTDHRKMQAEARIYPTPLYSNVKKSCTKFEKQEYLKQNLQEILSPELL
jgi:hypothetical protein